MEEIRDHKTRMETVAVRAGARAAQPDYVPTIPPIHPSVTYSYESMQDLDEVFGGTRAGYVYSRYGNPTVTTFEEAAAALEGGQAALAFGSGMAAIHAALLASGATAGSTIVAAPDVYGATYALLDRLLRSQGVDTHFVDVTDLEGLETACDELKPAALLVETISNPLLKVADLPNLALMARRHNVPLLVDSTFATPFLVQPLALGADVVIHSATKYLAGHGDVLGGVVVTSKERRDDMLETLKLTGGNLGPFEAWLALRGIRTLALRMRQHYQNALTVAQWLESHAKVNRVLYPGLASHPQHKLAKQLFGKNGYGGIVSFEVDGADQDQIFRLFENLRLVIPATSLGDVCTLALYPAHSSHRALTSEERGQIGIGDGLVRLSVGIEATEDILNDLDQALDSV
jgi:cystathionine gamma-synthase/methionine-gamma-lyase